MSEADATCFVALRRALLVLLMLAMSAGCDSAQPPTNVDFDQSLNKILAAETAIPSTVLQQGKVGIGLIPRNYNDSVESWLQALRVARHLGVQVLQLPSGYWKEDEPLPGAYQWQAMDRFIEALDKLGVGFEIAQDFGGPYFHAQNMAPEFLQPIALTDPAFAAAYLQYLQSYLQRFGKRVSRLLIHAEGTYSYFDKYPDHIDAYLALLAQIKKQMREVSPQTRLGVNIDPHNKPQILSAIAAQVDFVGFDLVQIEDVLDEPGKLPKVVEFVLANTGGKPISIAGAWSSAGTGGSDAAQAEFVRELFSVLRKHRSRIDYVAVGPPFEEDKKIVGPAYEAQFAHLADQFVADIIAWSTQLGLIRVDGTGKPALQTLRNELRTYFSEYSTTAK